MAKSAQRKKVQMQDTHIAALEQIMSQGVTLSGAVAVMLEIAHREISAGRYEIRPGGLIIATNADSSAPNQRATASQPKTRRKALGTSAARTQRQSPDHATPRATAASHLTSHLDHPASSQTPHNASTEPQEPRRSQSGTNGPGEHAETLTEQMRATGGETQPRTAPRYDRKGRAIPPPPPRANPLPVIDSEFPVYNPTGLTQELYDDLSEEDKECLSFSAFYYEPATESVSVREDLPTFAWDSVTKSWREVKNLTVGDWGLLRSIRMPGDDPGDFTLYKFAEEGDPNAG